MVFNLKAARYTGEQFRLSGHSEAKYNSVECSRAAKYNGEKNEHNRIAQHSKRVAQGSLVQLRAAHYCAAQPSIG